MIEGHNRLQALLEAQVGKGNIFNIVAAVQSYDRSLDSLARRGLPIPIRVP